MLRIWEALSEFPGVRVDCVSLTDSDQALARILKSNGSGLIGYNNRRFAFTLEQIARNRSDCVAVVGHLNLAPVAAIAKLLGRIGSYVIVLHGIEAWQRRNWASRFAMRHARMIVGTTNYTVDLNACLNDIPRHLYHVIPLCAAREVGPIDGTFSLNGEYPLLTVARLDSTEKYKGIEIVIDSLKPLREAGIPVHLNVVGDGGDRQRLERYVNEQNCSKLVTFWGRLSHSEIEAAYRSAAVFVLPSKKEGFGIVFLEAMRHGVPCIGGNHGGTPEVLADGREGYLVDYGDKCALVKRIGQLFRNPDLSKQFSDNCRKRFAESFSFDVFSTHWRDMIRGLLAK